MRTLPLFLAGVTLLTAPVVLALQGKPKQPQASPAASVSQRVGLTNVEIRYHRPAVKGRAIWGGLVPYDAVWRAGANNATTISFENAVKVAGKDVPAGTYSFFAVPTAKSWTLVLNKTAEQWGAYKYAQAEDLLRFEVQPTEAPMQEWLRYTIEPTGSSSAQVRLAWEKLAVEFSVEDGAPVAK